MSETVKHTPGPWVYLDLGEIVTEADLTVTVASIDYDRERAEDDGNLMAAAPDLLEALSELMDLMDAVHEGSYTPDSFTTQPARLAIAKATGGSNG